MPVGLATYLLSNGTRGDRIDCTHRGSPRKLRPLLARDDASRPSCRLAVVSAPECDGVVDPDPLNQYAVHHWLDRSLRSMTIWPDATTADVVLWNASINHPHRRRFPCAHALAKFAKNLSTRPIVAVDFTTRPLSHTIDRDFLRKRNASLNLRNILFVSMDPFQGSRSIIVPHVTASPCWLVGRCDGPEPSPWPTRKLLFFAGRVPKRRISHLRDDLAQSLWNRTNVTCALTYARLEKTPAGFYPVRLPFEEYIAQAMAHRFCLVASGDNLATPKFGESILFAARGGCLPFVFCSVRQCPWPFGSRLALHRVAVFGRMLTLEQDLDRIGRMSETEMIARREAARAIAPHYAFAADGQWSAAHAIIDSLCERAERDACGPN
jgi:hypothetical protein